VVKNDFKQIVGRYEIERRFADFNNLNEMLQARFKKAQLKLPKMPPKVSLTGSSSN
jgi:hypothetical protein